MSDPAKPGLERPGSLLSYGAGASDPASETHAIGSMEAANDALRSALQRLRGVESGRESADSADQEGDQTQGPARTRGEVRERPQRNRRLAAGERTDQASEIPLAADEWRPLIDPRLVLSGIVRSARLVAAATIAGALIGVMFALSTPKKYEAASDILIDPRDIRLVDRELVSTSLSMEAALAIIENQIRLLTSARVVDRVVDELNLTYDSEFNGREGGFGFRSLLAEIRSLLSRGDGAEVAGRDRAITIRNLMENLHVAREGKTFVVTVAATTRNPEKSAIVVNKVVDVFLDESGKLISSTAGKAAAELGAQLDALRAGVEEAERRVEAFKAENDLIDARGRLIGDDEIIALNQQLTTARARTVEVRARAQSVRAADAQSVLNGGLPEGVGSGVITELRAQYAALTREASRLGATVGPLHPQRRTVEAQLEEARQQIRAELGRIVAAIQVELRRAIAEEQALAQRLAELKGRQIDVGGEMVTLRELEREAAARRAVYESYLLRTRETGEQQNLNMANVSVISRADPPLEPVGPSRTWMSLAGLVSGLMLGIGIGGLRGIATSIRNGPLPPGRGRQDSADIGGQGSDPVRAPLAATDRNPHRGHPQGAGGHAYRTADGHARANPAVHEYLVAPEIGLPCSPGDDWPGDPAGSSAYEDIRDELRQVRSALHDIAARRARRRA